MKELHEPLKHVARKMEIFQRADLTLSDVYGEWFDLKETLKTLPQTEFLKKLQEGISAREGSLLSNTLMYSSLFLDPRLNLLLTSSQKSIALSLITELYNKLYEIPAERIARIDSVESEASTSTTSSETELSDIDGQCSALENHLRTIESTNRENHQISHIQLEAEIKCFQRLPRLPTKASIHEFWQKSRQNFPIIYKIASIIMAVPPAEVCVERNFSRLNFILNRFRTNLKDKELEKILFLSLNRVKK